MDAGTRYEGTEPYIFISYSHRDGERVLPALDALRRRGYRLWYDAEIPAGEQWTDELAKQISGCAVFLPFLSDSYNKSRHCMQEIKFANSRQRTVVPVWLTDKHSLLVNLQYQLGDYQGTTLPEAPDDLAAWADSLYRRILGEEDAADDGTAYDSTTNNKRTDGWRNTYIDHIDKILRLAVRTEGGGRDPVCGNPSGDCRRGAGPGEAGGGVCGRPGGAAVPGYVL